MNNVVIEGIRDLNVVTNLFSQVGCVEADNCILVMTNRDFGAIDSAGDMMTSNATRVGAKNGGIVGGLVAGAVAGAINESIKEQVGELPKKHKLIPYQEANFNKLAARM